MAESFNTWIMRLGFNLFPCYRCTGARVTYIAEDQREVRIRLPLNWKTRGYFGTTSGRTVPSAWLEAATAPALGEPKAA